MSEQRPVRQRGQTLVIVALTLTVLMLMAGLAVDVGMAYNDRRDMQNAADAAALAGAQKWCDSQEATAGDFARYVAVTLNGADDAMTQVTSANYTVNVIAGMDAQTFFFRLIGIDSVPVSAEAEAVCGCAEAAGGIWPVVFDEPSWDEMGTCEDEGYLMVWSDDVGFQWEDSVCAVCDCTRAEEDYLLPSDFFENLKVYGAEGTDTGDRGWARLGVPSGYTGVNGTSCGDSLLEHWLRVGYQGIIDVGYCVPGKPGIGSAIEGVEDQIGKTVSILLFQPPSTAESDCEYIVGEENGSNCNTGVDYYEITRFGCIHVMGWARPITFFEIDPDKPETNKKCSIDGKLMEGSVIFAKKVCNGCDPSGAGSSGPILPFPGCIVSASLTK